MKTCFLPGPSFSLHVLLSLLLSPMFQADIAVPAIVQAGVHGPPAITSISPELAAVGDAVLIFGTNLERTVEVKFNGVPARFVTDLGMGPAVIHAWIPENATTGFVTVVTEDGTG